MGTVRGLVRVQYELPRAIGAQREDSARSTEFQNAVASYSLSPIIRTAHCKELVQVQHSGGGVRQSTLPPSRVATSGPLTDPGIFHTSTRWDWRSSQRDRLALFAKDRHAWPHDDPVLVDRGVATGGGVRREIWDHDELVGRYLDVGLVPRWVGAAGFRLSASTSASTGLVRLSIRAVESSCGRVIGPYMSVTL